MAVTQSPRGVVALCSQWLDEFHQMVSDFKLPPARLSQTKIIVQAPGQVLSAQGTSW